MATGFPHFRLKPIKPGGRGFIVVISFLPEGFHRATKASRGVYLPADAVWLCGTHWAGPRAGPMLLSQFKSLLTFPWPSLVAQLVKNPPAMRETWV